VKMKNLMIDKLTINLKIKLLIVFTVFSAFVFGQAVVNPVANKEDVEIGIVELPN